MKELVTFKITLYYVILLIYGAMVRNSIDTFVIRTIVLVSDVSTQISRYSVSD